MEGSIILSYLITGTNQAKEYLVAEITEHKGKRRTTMKRKTTKKKQTVTTEVKVKQWEDLSETELRHLLRDHEHGHLTKEEDKVFAKAEDVNFIKQLSIKMKQWMPKQWNEE